MDTPRKPDSRRSVHEIFEIPQKPNLGQWLEAQGAAGTQITLTPDQAIELGTTILRNELKIAETRDAILAQNKQVEAINERLRKEQQSINDQVKSLNQTKQKLITKAKEARKEIVLDRKRNYDDRQALQKNIMKTRRNNLIATAICILMLAISAHNTATQLFL